VEAVFLRDREGQPVGPITPTALEVLWDARVVDRGTPVSFDGVAFGPVGDHAELLEHLEAVKRKLDEGEDPWPERVRVHAPSAPPETPGEAETTTALLLRHARLRSRGVLELPTDAGTVTLTFRDGKIVAVHADDPRFALDSWLIEAGLASTSQLDEARQRAPAMGGDLGGALVAGGALAPDVYFENLKTWARSTVGRCLLRRFDAPRFTPEDVPPPPVPLGFDRYGLLLEALREVTDRSELERRLLDRREAPLIPSQVEGASFEDMKPRPRELRVVNAINGAVTLGNLLDELGGSDDRSRDVLRAVLFATEAGFVVFGVDPRLEKDEQEARRLERLFEEMQAKNFFELFEVSEKSSDEEVRQRYADFAKLYHPDRLRQNAAPALRDITERIFAYINEVFSELETSDQRYQYALDLDAGRVGGAADRQKVEAALEAETAFKKAEILLRMKKYDEAIEQIDAALALTPGETEFQILRTYCVYLEAARKGDGEAAAATAIKTILNLMKTDANIARGYLYLGYLNKAVNKPEVATRYFKKVLEYDEAHPEATREVRLANARKERTKKRRWSL
jgi:tetratricopeptide (TPR) repeat protein